MTERIHDAFSNLDSELDNLIGLLDDIDLADSQGNWTTDAITKLGLLGRQYELSQYQVQQYAEEIEKLKQEYLAGNYSATEYTDKLAELTQSQWDAVNASEAAKNAMLEMNKARVEEIIEGIESEKDAYKELIDTQLEAIDAAEELRDKQKDLEDKSDAVTAIERQIAAMQGDTTASGIAKRKQLEAELADAKEALAEAEHDYSIEAQKDALNKQYEDFAASKDQEISALEKSLEDETALFAQFFETIRQNASLFGQELAQIAQQYGVTLSDALTTSSFTGGLENIAANIWHLQTQADDTANSLLNLFTADASTFVAETEKAYTAQETLLKLVTPPHRTGNFSSTDTLLSADSSSSGFDWSNIQPASFDWSKLEPANIVPDFITNLYSKTQFLEIPERSTTSAPSVHVDSLIHVDKVDSSNIKQMEAIANNAVDRLVNRIYDGVKYGR